MGAMKPSAQSYQLQMDSISVMKCNEGFNGDKSRRIYIILVLYWGTICTIYYCTHFIRSSTIILIVVIKINFCNFTRFKIKTLNMIAGCW